MNRRLLACSLVALIATAGCGGLVDTTRTDTEQNGAVESPTNPPAASTPSGNSPESSTGAPATTVPPKLIAIWNMTSVDGSPGHAGPHEEMKDYMQIGFRADGTLTLRKSGTCTQGTFTVADHKLKIVAKGFAYANTPDAGTYQFTDEGLSIAYAYGSYYWSNWKELTKFPICE